MTDKMRVGMIGAGMVSQYHVQGWLDCHDAQLVAVADPDVHKAKERARRVSGARAFASLAEMVAECDLDAVDIVTPPPTHAALIAEAQAVGLHVICQKPLALDANAARSIVEAQDPDLRAMVHENWRWRHPYRALKTALDRGDISRPETFEFRVESSGLLTNEHSVFPALERQPVFATMDRLLVFELLIHHLDTLSFLFGALNIHAARLGHQCEAVVGEDSAEIALSAGEIKGKLIGSFCVPGAPSMPTDRLFLDGKDVPVIDGWSIELPSKSKRSWDEASSYQESYSHTIEHFRNCVRSGNRFDTEFRDALLLQAAVERIYDCAR